MTTHREGWQRERVAELVRRVAELERALLRIRDSQESDLDIYAKFCQAEAVTALRGKKYASA